MKLMGKFITGIFSLLLIAAAWAGTKEAPGQTVDSGSFAILVNGQRVATEKFNIQQAADYLHATVPMDSATALDEASSFAMAPGQAISYQIGRSQIMNFLAEARRQQGDKFSLRAFHDYLWLNGNVPIVLQRWEYLGMKNDLERVDALPQKSQ